MTKLAILIGVSEYEKVPNLPACLHDVELMQEVVKSAGTFDDTLVLTGLQTKSSLFKSSISAFFSKHSNDKNIEEIFFYFSGHGMTVGDNFNYILSDYDPKKISTTCYANSELDETIRSLDPKLTIKIVDACQSGQQYIKDVQDFKTVFDKVNKSTLKNLYFLFSCASNQSSYCDSNYSFFTKSLASGIANHGVDDIRYRDLIDFISDNFQADLDQKPYFVTQGNNTEIFGTFGTVNKNKLTAMLDKPHLPIIADNAISSSIVEILRNKAKEYVTEQEIVVTLNYIEDTIYEYKFSTDINELYNLKINSKDSIESIPVFKAAAFADQNKAIILAKVRYQTIIRKVPKYNALMRLASLEDLLGNSTKTEYVEKEVTEPYSYEQLLQNLPYLCIEIDLVSKLPNLSSFTCTVVYVLTPLEINIFSNISEIKFIELIGNRKIEYKNNKQYCYKSRELFEKKIIADEIMRDFESYIHAYMRNAAGISEPVAEQIKIEDSAVIPTSASRDTTKK